MKITIELDEAAAAWIRYVVDSDNEGMSKMFGEGEYQITYEQFVENTILWYYEMRCREGKVPPHLMRQPDDIPF